MQSETSLWIHFIPFQYVFFAFVAARHRDQSVSKSNLEINIMMSPQIIAKQNKT